MNALQNIQNEARIIVEQLAESGFLTVNVEIDSDNLPTKK